MLCTHRTTQEQSHQIETCRAWLEYITKIDRCKYFWCNHYSCDYSSNPFVEKKERTVFSRTQHGPHVSLFFVCPLRVNTRTGFFDVRKSTSCRGDEDVQGVLTLFGRGKAQVCHVLRVVELREQLEVEEEDGDRQEEEEEVESGETSQRGAPMDDMEMTVKCAQNLSHEVCVYHHKLWKMRSACRLSACTPRVR